MLDVTPNVEITGAARFYLAAVRVGCRVGPRHRCDANWFFTRRCFLETNNAEGAISLSSPLPLQLVNLAARQMNITAMTPIESPCAAHSRIFPYPPCSISCKTPCLPTGWAWASADTRSCITGRYRSAVYLC